VKCKCKLCGEEFDSTELEAKNDSFGEIIITCPNGCRLKYVSVNDLLDIEKLEK